MAITRIYIDPKSCQRASQNILYHFLCSVCSMLKGKGLCREPGDEGQSQAEGGDKIAGKPGVMHSFETGSVGPKHDAKWLAGCQPHFASGRLERAT